MPVHVERRGKRFRIVEPSGNIAETPQGNPRDGGGHATREEANRQMRAINASLYNPDWRKSISEEKTLYVSRRLANASNLIRWARNAGFYSVTPAEHMHATIAYSKEPVSWLGLTPSRSRVTVHSAANRKLESLGDKGAVVLRFNSNILTHSWQQFINHGCSWDWEDFKPHVTITYEAGDLDITKIKPFAGPLIFAREVFREIDEDWQDSVMETNL